MQVSVAAAVGVTIAVGVRMPMAVCPVLVVFMIVHSVKPSFVLVYPGDEHRSEYPK